MEAAHDYPVTPNLLDQCFAAAAPNRSWVADIPYVQTEEGWLYVAVLLDRYSRRVVGVERSGRDLVITAGSARSTSKTVTP